MRHARIFTFCLLMLVAISVQAETDRFTDLRRAVPADAHMAVWGRRNPERDFQRQYLREVWDTVEQTNIIDRAWQIVTTRMDKHDLDKAQATIDELREAIQTTDWGAIVECEEVVYAQQMEFPQNHHLLIVQLTPSVAADCETAMQNLFSLIETKTEGKVSVATKAVKEVELTILELPEKVPFSPTFARIDDVIIVSTSHKMARRSAKMLVREGGRSKFDDPRLRKALKQLPEPEDSLLFLDGKQLFDRLGKMSSFIEQQAHGDEKAQRVADMMETVFDQLGVLDYQVAVEFTEDHRNCKTELVKLLSNSEDKLLVRMLSQGQPFEDWQRWVPADAISYSLTTGVNLHTLYEWLVNELPNQIPETEKALQRFETLQSEWELNVDRDILQAFSGETVTLTLPAEGQSTTPQGPQTLMALRCQKPDEIRKLLHRGVEELRELPALQAQQLQFQECAELKDFEELSATILAAVGARPVVGFHEGWMIIGSHPTVVKRLLDTRSGEAKLIAETAAFQQFGLEIDGPVSSIYYTNLARQTRQIATRLNQVGLVLPMIVGLAGADEDDEGLQVVQEIVGLLPSVSRIISKFDFLEKRITVSQDGEEPLTAIKRTVITIRPPAEQEDAEEENTDDEEVVTSSGDSPA